MHRALRNERWNLAEKPELYPWSSARFYETGIHDFGFLTLIRNGLDNEIFESEYWLSEYSGLCATGRMYEIGKCF